MNTPRSHPEAAETMQRDPLRDAAPDLLAACKEALKHFEALAINADTNWWCIMLRKTIAKAEGK